MNLAIERLRSVLIHSDTDAMNRIEVNPPSNATWHHFAAIDPVEMAVPLVTSPRPQAGFPSPATDFVEDTIDLNKLLVTNPPATFFVRVEGESLKNIGILSGDLAAVDRSIEPRSHGEDVVVAVFQGDMYIKVLEKVDGRLALCSRHDAVNEYPPMFLDEDDDHIIWGVVTGFVRDTRRRR